EVDGAPLIGTWGGGAWRWDARGWQLVGPADARIQALAARAGEIALGTPAGIVRVDAAGGWTIVRRGGLPANDLSARASTSDGGAGVGLFDRGRARVARGGEVIGAWTEADGLLDARVTALAADAHGVWIATDRGLAWGGERGGFRAFPPLDRHVGTV